MSGVLRFKSHEDGREWVRGADFDRVQAENGALQELLNQRDEANHALEQRRYAEQQAREAAERRVEELEELLRCALQYHGIVLLTDPPQDAWKHHRMSERIGSALSQNGTPTCCGGGPQYGHAWTCKNQPD